MIRILIADDSELTRVVLCDLLSEDAEIKVVCEVSNGQAAVEKTAELKPDLVIMDVMMPVMDGLEAVAEIMANTPTPILMLSANADPQDIRSAFGAIRLGALDVMEKPSGVVTEAFSQIACKLIAKVKSLSRIKVIHHYRAQRPKLPEPKINIDAGKRRILAVGASTGGPKAVLQLLQGFPKNFPASVLVVQHIADGFASGFAAWLDRETALPVRLAVDGQKLVAGEVLVAPNNLHMKVQGNRIMLEPSAPVNNCRPAVDALYQSLAQQGLAAETVAVLLTGMGSDGASGMAELHKLGAYTIAQNEGSCVVFGMPKSAIERGAADQVLPLEQISTIAGRFFSA